MNFKLSFAKRYFQIINNDGKNKQTIKTCKEPISFSVEYDSIHDYKNNSNNCMGMNKFFRPIHLLSLSGMELTSIFANICHNEKVINNQKRTYPPLVIFGTPTNRILKSV